MKISIITVTYNSGATLRDTIESVLSQTYKNIEYIIIDGNSTDNTLQIIKEYEPMFGDKLKYISEPDNGIYDAMNKGIRIATGEIVGLLNSDDFFADTQVLDTIVTTFEAQKVHAVFGNLIFVSKKNKNKIIRVWRSSPFIQGSFLKGWHPPHPTLYLKKEVYQNYGVFNNNFLISADFELMLRFFEVCKISSYFINHTLVVMRMGGESTGSIKKIINGNLNIIKAFRFHNLNISWLTYISTRLFFKLKQFLSY